MINQAENPLGESQILPEISPNIPPIYAKCISCPDYGTSCRGLDLRYLGDVNTIRAFHRALKKAHPSITLRAIAAEAKIISDNTINEYFSNVIKNDYKWTTVIAIDNALLTLCGNRIGLPPIDHSCPESSSDVRSKLAAADLKLAAADLRAAQSETSADDLRQKLIEVKSKSASRVDQLQAAHEKDMEWMKSDVQLWRRFAFILLGIGAILLMFLMFYIGWDIAHPGYGLIY